jgi:hypothetical protein
LSEWLAKNHPDKGRTVATPAGVQILVHKCGEGDFFGEIALLNSVPRQATVKAVGPTTLLVLHRDAFERLCGNLFEILKRDMSKYSDIAIPEAAEEPDADEAVEDEGEDEQLIVEEPPAAAKAYLNASGRRRSNVFVEAVKLEDDWKAPSFTKSMEETLRLENYIAGTSLLKHLDLSLRNTVIQVFLAPLVSYLLGIVVIPSSRFSLLHSSRPYYRICWE